MQFIKWSLPIIIGAFIGAFLLTFAWISVLVLAGFVYTDYGGLSLALYYGGGWIIYTIPAGTIFGALLTSLILGFKHVSDATAKRKNPEQTSNKSALAGLYIALPVILIVGGTLAWAMSIYSNKQITHGASWLTEERTDCDVDVVVLMIKDYGVYEIICSDTLLEYINTRAGSVIPVMYDVDYYFGEPHSYQLVHVGPISLDWEHWIRAGGGCGGPYTLPCSELQPPPPSHLIESSWPEN